ncbi:MAG TPA: hypothetical protein VIQ31_05680 [Phormidium sp.]
MSKFKILAEKILGKIQRYFQRKKYIRGQKKVESLLVKSGGMVYSGPFATMPIPPNILEAHERYLIVGSYEECIHSEIYKLIVRQPKCGVIIGAHKGYYVSGLLYTIQDCFISAFESSESLHLNLKSWAHQINAVDRLSINGYADMQALKSIAYQPDFLIIDCEGGEDELLQPALIPWLSAAFIICELHDFYKPGLLSRLIARFSKTHDIKIIESKEVDILNYAILKDFSKLEAERCVAEERWIYSENPSGRILTSGRFMVADPK